MAIHLQPPDHSETAKQLAELIAELIAGIPEPDPAAKTFALIPDWDENGDLTGDYYHVEMPYQSDGSLARFLLGKSGHAL